MPVGGTSQLYLDQSVRVLAGWSDLLALHSCMHLCLLLAPAFYVGRAVGDSGAGARAYQLGLIRRRRGGSALLWRGLWHVALRISIGAPTVEDVKPIVKP